jgi:hypothetical protein
MRAYVLAVALVGCGGDAHVVVTSLLRWTVASLCSPSLRRSPR